MIDVIDGLLRILGLAYGTGASLAAVSLSFFFGPRVVRGFFKEIPHLTLADWLLVPIIGLFVLMGGGIGLWLACLLWPGTLLFLFRHWKGEKERLLTEETQEYESLLDEVQHLKGEVPSVPHHR